MNAPFLDGFRSEHPEIAELASQVEELVASVVNSSPVLDENDPEVDSDSVDFLTSPFEIEELCFRIGLDEFEEFVLKVTLAFAVLPALNDLAAVIQVNQSRRFLDFGLLQKLNSTASTQILDPQNSLSHFGLIRLISDPFLSLLEQPIQIDPRLLNHCLGNVSLDPQLKHFCRPLGNGGLFDASRFSIQERSFFESLENESFGAIGDEDSILDRWDSVIADDYEIHLVDSELLPMRTDELDQLALMFRREWALGRKKFALLVKHDSIESARRLFQSSEFPWLVIGYERHTLQSLGIEIIDIPGPGTKDQEKEWMQYFDGKEASVLASEFDLEIHQINAACRASENCFQDAWRRCLDFNRPSFGRLASEVKCLATRDDVVLPEGVIKKLDEVCDQARYRHKVLEEWGFSEKTSRGLSTTVLLTGESGCGKTMSAEMIAHRLQKPLYRIDLSTVVDKYIGETEKNLNRIFDQAQKSRCVLFFDECDSLFAKRGSISDARDRYANMEVSYLLQRLEAFDGLAILATNIRRNLDKAFLRRFKFVIDFPIPDQEDRKKIWSRSIPERLPISDIDFDRLSRVQVSGGTISNAVLNSAYQSAAASSALTTELLLDSLRHELEKAEQPINELDFRNSSRMEVVA